MPRPKTGETPIRHIRIDDETWGKVEQAAEEDGTTSTGIVKHALGEYLTRRARRKRAAQ